MYAADTRTSLIPDKYSKAVFNQAWVMHMLAACSNTNSTPAWSRAAHMQHIHKGQGLLVPPTVILKACARLFSCETRN
jgi:hypothetical protein